MKLIIPAAVEAKLNAYVQSVDTEIAGMGKIKVIGDGEFEVVDVAIYTQEVTFGTADLSTEALAKFQTDLIRAGESPKDWTLWWHSHASMAAFFSNRDTTTMGESTEFPWLMSLVVNRKRERKARLDIFYPAHVYNEEIAIEVERIPEPARVQELIKEIKERQSEIVRIKVDGEGTATIPADIKKEVEEKVKVKSYQSTITPGYRRTYVTDEDVDDNWAGHGIGKKLVPYKTLYTPEPTIDDAVSIADDEVLTIIEVLKVEIKNWVQRGEGQDPECLQLKQQLADWEYEYQMRQDQDKLFDEKLGVAGQ